MTRCINTSAPGRASAESLIGIDFTPTTTVRSCTMLLMNEELARAHMRQLEADAMASSQARRVLAAKRWTRRAERAAARARQAQSAVR